MAIVACPSCGKRITDRMEVCPHCGVALREPEAPKIPSREEAQSSVKGNIPHVLIGLALTIAVALVVFWAAIISGRVYGQLAIVAVAYSRIVFLTRILVLLIVEAVWLCAFPLVIKVKIRNQLIVYAASVILFSFLGCLVQHQGVIHIGDVSMEAMLYGRRFAPGFGAGFVMLLGALAIPGGNMLIRKPIVLQVILGLMYVVLFWILSAVFITFGMGLQCISYANIIPAVLILAFGILTSKGFQKLILPKATA